MVTTNCITGRACYLEEKHDPRRIIAIAKASSSLPYVCPIAYVDGEPMLDGELWILFLCCVLLNKDLIKM